jgi:hypothetical protein
LVEGVKCREVLEKWLGKYESGERSWEGVRGEEKEEEGWEEKEEGNGWGVMRGSE